MNVLTRRSLLLVGLLIVLMGTTSVILAQDAAKPFVRLATYWDAPGRVIGVSKDDRWIVVYDMNTDTSRLVEVATGAVKATNAGDGSIRFSPKGEFVTVKLADTETFQLIDLKAGQLVAEVNGSSPKFSADESLMMADRYDDSIKEWFTKVVDTQTGHIRFEVQGLGYNFSPDGKLLTISDTLNRIAKMIEIDTLKTVFEFPLRDYSEGQIWDFTFRFSPDGHLLRINQLHDSMTYVIDTSTWKILYNIFGFVTFSTDSHYAIVRDSDNTAALNLLLDAKTGKRLDEVYGDMWFSEDGKLLYRMNSTNCQYRGAVRVMNLATMKTLIDVQGCVNVELLANNMVAHVTCCSIDEPQIQKLIEVSTDKVLWQSQAHYMDVIDYSNHLALMTGQEQQAIENFETGEVFASGEEIIISNSHKIAFVSNGSLVDLYGAPNVHIGSMSSSLLIEAKR